MAKKLIFTTDIDVNQNAVIFEGNIPLERILLITNVTAGANKIIYNFADSTVGATSCTYIPSSDTTVLILSTNFGTASPAITADSKLQIFLEEEFARVGFEEAMLDPVNKLRISSPENLIDTDFEYGSQSTKWETLQSVLNIPTIYSSSGDLTLEGLTSISTTNSSKQVRCVFTLPHGQVVGNAIQVTGVSNITCEGAFLVTGVVNTLEFFYEIDQAAITTENVAGSYSSVIPAKFFEGSNLILDFNALDVDGNPVPPIQTNGASPSSLSVRTLEPHGLKVGTKVYLRQTIGPKELTIVDPTGTAPDGRPFIDSSPTITVVQAVAATTSLGAADFQYDRSVVTWDWSPTYAKYLQTSDINAGTDEITWATHGLTANAALLYQDPIRGDDTTNTSNGGLTDGTVYYAKIIDANTIQLCTDYGTLAAIVNLSAITTSRGFPRLGLVYKVEGRTNGTTKNTAFFTRNVTTGQTGNNDRGASTNTATIQFNWNIQSILTGTRIPTKAVIYQINFGGANTGGSPINTTYLARNYLNLGSANLTFAVVGGGSVFPNLDVTRCLFATSGSHSLDIQYQFSAINRDKFGNPTSNFSINFFITCDSVPATLNTAHSGSDLAAANFGKGARAGNRIIGFQGRIPGGSSSSGSLDGFSFQANTRNNGRFGTSNPPYSFVASSTNTLGQIVHNYPESGDQNYGSGSEIYLGFADDFSFFKNTFYVPTHGISNNEICTLSVTGAGVSSTNRFSFINSSATVVPYNDSAFSVTANVVNSNYLRFTSRLTPFTNDIGSFPAAFTITNNKTNVLYNTIFIDNHKVSGATTATYTTAGTVIGGLTSGTNFSLQFVNDSRLIIKSAGSSGAGTATTAAFGSTSISASQAFNVNVSTPLAVADPSPTNCVITMVQHRGRLSTSARFVSITFGDAINYRIGAVNGQDTSTFQNEPTWVPKDVSSILTSNGGNRVIPVLASPAAGVNAAVAGMANWWELRFVISATVGTILLTSSGAGTQVFNIINQDGAYDGIYAIATTPTSESFTFNAPFKIPARTYSFNSRLTSAGGAVETVNDTITIGTSSNPVNPHNMFPGQLISYVQGAGNTDIVADATTNNAYLFAIPTTQYLISLSNSYVSAIAGQKLQITATSPSQTQTISTTNVLKCTAQNGSVSGTSGARVLIGSGTAFLSKFKRFDSIYIFIASRLQEFSVDRVVSDTELTIDPGRAAFPSTFSAAEYATITSVNLRPDGFSLHKSFDGGIDITAGTSPNSKIVRQSRKYFRYQSGKGIQNSFAINFSPLKTVQLLEYVNLGTGGSPIHAVRVVCQEPHNLSVGNSVIIEKAVVTVGNNLYNGTFQVNSVINNVTFTYLIGSAPQQQSAAGFTEYGREGWQQSAIRAGMFDDANGFFFEYDGEYLYAVRRSSTLQLSGFCQATKNSQVITGDGTIFQSQLVVGSHVQIRGQIYRVIAIDSDSRMVVQPPYRGITATGIKVTIREDVRVKQSDWNIDPCDGTGPNGYTFNIHKIQMCYADYSWYGAGKIRFGTKDAKGHIHYHHEFVHNNKLNESYLRSGNLPARYEIENGDAPTSAPTLFHFGTSVIMDGTFDDDDAYLFTAQSKPFVYAVGSSATTTSTANSVFSEITLNARRVFVYSYQCSEADANKVIVGQLIKDATSNIPDGSFVAQVSKSGAASRIFTSFPATTAVPNNTQIPAGTVFTVGETAHGGTAVDLSRPIPLVSIRLAPAVDSGITGSVGEREIINRMQMKLNSGAVTTNKSVNVFFILNGNPSKLTFEKVQAPSLSNLISHDTGDIIKDGTVIFSTQVSSGSTNLDLTGLIDMGNSILGGDSVYPNGPDLLTLAVQPTDTSTITSASPMIVTGKLSWSESQA